MENSKPFFKKFIIGLIAGIGMGALAIAFLEWWTQ